MKTLLFTSPTCGPCKQMKMDLAAAGIGAEITEIDISIPQSDAGEHKQLITSYGIRSVPTLIRFDDDEEIVKIVVGVPSNNDYITEFFKA